MIKYFLLTLLSFNMMNESRRLLTVLRGGDYAHAGDQKAIELIIEKGLKISEEIVKGPCLDVGSGFGGSAYDFYSHGFSSIYGIDIDEAAIAYAKKRYPEISFSALNALQIEEKFDQETFRFIYLLNVFYAIQEKKDLLESLYRIAKPGALLALFDYKTTKEPFDLKDLAGKPMFPLSFPSIETSIEEAGWKIVEIIDLSSEFLSWYEDLLHQLEMRKQELSLDFKQEEILKVETTFQTIYSWLKTKEMGGVLIFCQKYPLD